MTETDYIRQAYAGMTIEELENAAYTLRFERQFLDMTDDEAVDRMNAIELAKFDWNLRHV